MDFVTGTNQNNSSSFHGLLWKCICILIYYGIVLLTTELINEKKCRSRGSSSSPLAVADPYKDVFITSFAELPGLLFSAVIVDRVGRKLSMLAMLFLAGVFLFPLMFHQKEVVITVLLFGARACITGSINTLYIYAPEFMTEMKETAFLMQNVSPRSLVVIDELGRATSSSDGFAIAWSCCEYLLPLRAYTLFATHMEGLSELATMYPNVKILHFEVDLRNNRLDFKFRLKDGPRLVPHYGLLLAGVAGLPSSVVETARSIATRIKGKETNKMDINCEQYHSIQMAYHVAQRLICLKYSTQGDDEIRQALQNLKERYVEGKLT